MIRHRHSPIVSSTCWSVSGANVDRLRHKASSESHCADPCFSMAYYSVNQGTTCDPHPVCCTTALLIMCTIVFCGFRYCFVRRPLEVYNSGTSSVNAMHYTRLPSHRSIPPSHSVFAGIDWCVSAMHPLTTRRGKDRNIVEAMPLLAVATKPTTRRTC